MPILVITSHNDSQTFSAQPRTTLLTLNPSVTLASGLNEFKKIALPDGLQFRANPIEFKGIQLKDFHSSKGNVFNLNDVEEIYEPEILRYLFVGTKPKSASAIISWNLLIQYFGSIVKFKNPFTG